MSEDPVPYIHAPPGVPVAWLGPGPEPPRPASPFLPSSPGPLSGPGKPLPAASAAKPRAAARRKKPRSVRYGPGRYAPAPNGRGYDCAVTIGGERLRARMPDEASARAWIDATEASAADALPPLTRAQLIDARHALSLLPEGATLAQAARAMAEARGLRRMSLGEAVPLFLADRAHGAVPLTVRGYRIALKALALACGEETPVGAVTAAHITQAVGYRTGRARNNIIRHLATFFRWAIRAGACGSNPALAVPRARVSEPPRGILTVAQAEALLRRAEKERPGLIPYLALGLFGGIRPAELLRLDPARIGSEWIVIDGAVAKTADHRTVPIRANLRAWLDAHPPPAKRIAPLNERNLYAAIRRLRAAPFPDGDGAGEIPWPADCMRHSYASYAYDLTRDAALVSSEMGHRGTDIFFRHYRGLVSPGDGVKYFGIFPTPCQRKP